MECKPVPLRQYLLTHSGQPDNRYGRFTDELLRSEGLNGFELVDLNKAPLPKFGLEDLAILTRCALTAAQAIELKSAVEGGLRLVCFQPSWNLVKLFGWTPAKRAIHPGWVRVEKGVPGGGETLQTHLPIALYEADAATTAACIVAAHAQDAQGSSGSWPAVVRQPTGTGEIVFFFYDLPHAVARIRFGDPDLASLLTTGLWEWQHAIDLFMGHVDERAIHLPQAELHTQLLAHLLTDICPYPLARLWYFEKPEHRAAANFSSDDDWSTPEQFQDLISSLHEYGGRGTFYLVEDTLLSEAQVEAYRAAGHTFGPHVDCNNRGEEMRLQFPQQLQHETQGFRERFGKVSLSLQCHRAPWCGYMDWLPDFVEHDFRLLYNYMSHPQWLNLYMCGAGRPVRFVDETGKIFDCWQQPMQTYDDGTLIEKIAHDLPAVVHGFEALLRPALERFHSAIGIGSHPVSFSKYSKPFLRACFALLLHEGVPLYSGDDWCKFTQRRDAVTMQYARVDGVIRLTLAQVRGNLTLMVPEFSAGGSTSAPPEISVDGKKSAVVLLRRLERSYLFVQIGDALTGSTTEVSWEPRTSHF